MVDGVCSVPVDVVMVMDEGLGVDGTGFGAKQVRCAWMAGSGVIPDTIPAFGGRSIVSPDNE